MHNPQSARRIAVFDTTLRDGEQAPRNALDPEVKLDLALRIEALGVDVIEAGFPASSPDDFRAARLIAGRLTGARLATFARSVRSDVDAAVEAAGTDRHQIQILAVGSEIHLEHKRGIDRATALRELRDTVRHAVALGVPHVSVAVEDATRGSRGLLAATVETAVAAGAEHVAIGDTTGCATPGEFGELIAAVRAWAPPPVTIGVHCHDDFGLALANTIAGVTAGADEVQVTLGGIGERAGNTALEQVVALLAYKADVLGVRTDVRTEPLHAAYTALRRAIGMPEARNQPIVGQFAFATAAGIHQQGILNDPTTYEYVRPARFGRSTQLLVARHSGRAVLRRVLADAGLAADDALVETVFQRHVKNRPGGDCVEMDDLRAEILAALAVA
ncbi:LeuA family protein [Actinoplanes sp. CA-054009]